MSTKLKIKVTKEILQRSMMCGLNAVSIGANCAVALAVRDIFPTAAVSSKYIFPFMQDPDYIISDMTINLPPEAESFISDFDNLVINPRGRLHLPELEFEIEIPDKILEYIDIKQITQLLENHPTLELINI